MARRVNDFHLGAAVAEAVTIAVTGSSVGELSDLEIIFRRHDFRSSSFSQHVAAGNVVGLAMGFEALHDGGLLLFGEGQVGIHVVFVLVMHPVQGAEGSDAQSLEHREEGLAGERKQGRVAGEPREVAQQRNMMRSRQSVAEAMRTINNIEGVSYGEIEDTFDRWEINLGETEILMGAVTDRDPLDSAFLAEEDTAELRAELEELLQSDKEDSS